MFIVNDEEHTVWKDSQSATTYLFMWDFCGPVPKGPGREKSVSCTDL
jgi:hypothetical protein